MLKKFILLFLRFYKRFLSPLLPHACRFTPTCSAYTYEAVNRHGIIRGLVLGGKRLLKCHPWSVTGHDPVPLH